MDLKYAAETWYAIDILLDWDRQEVAFFVDGTFRQQVPFYSSERDKFLRELAPETCTAAKKKVVDTLSLYTLTPGTTSSFAEVLVCQDFCLRAGELIGKPAVG